MREQGGRSEGESESEQGGTFDGCSLCKAINTELIKVAPGIRLATHAQFAPSIERAPLFETTEITLQGGQDGQESQGGRSTQGERGVRSTKGERVMRNTDRQGRGEVKLVRGEAGGDNQGGWRTLRRSREGDGALIEEREDEGVWVRGLGIRGEISGRDVLEVGYLVHLLRCVVPLSLRQSRSVLTLMSYIP